METECDPLCIKDENQLADSWVDSDEPHNQLTSEFECEDVKIGLADDSQPLPLQRSSSEFHFETVFVECVPEDDLSEEANSSNTDPISTGSAAKKSKHTCQVCLKTFKSSHNLASHVDAVHLGVKAYECDLCHKSFGWRGDVKKHIDAIHRGLRPHQCPQCPRSFGQKQTLKLHHDSVHRRLRPYRCDQCDLTFGQKKTLVAHRDSRHHGLRPYACTECPRSFTRKDLLRTHARAKHEKNSEKE